MSGEGSTLSVSLPGTLLDWVTLISVALGLVVVIFGRDALRKLWGWCKQQGASLVMTVQVVTQMKALHSKMDVVLAELKPNGGTSLRDAVNRLEDNQKALVVARQKADARMQAVLNYDTIPMFENDVDGRCVWVNRAMLAITGRQDRELLDHGWINAVHVDDRARVKALWDKAIAELRAFEEEFRYTHIDGHSYKARVHARPLIVDHQVHGWLGQAAVQLDPEEVKRAAAQMLEHGFDEPVPGYVLTHPYVRTTR